MNDATLLTIVVARPGEAGSRLCESITQIFGRALHVPAIAFAPPDDVTEFQTMLGIVDQQQWLIFNSPQAVVATIPALRARWPHLPPHVKFAAVGAGTAGALMAAGYQATLIPAKEWSSEGLLAMPELQNIAGQRIMVVRGQGGRELLERVLLDRGAVVASCLAYQRVLPETDTTACEQLIQQNNCAAVVAGSYETVTNFKKMLGEQYWPALSSIPLIVMSERVKNLAAEAGFQTIWVTKNASPEAVLDLISEKKEVLCQRTTKR